jgi:hypothetical protein
MGAGYSIVDGNIKISKERMQNIYATYCDPSAYNAWKKQLEDSKKKEIYTTKQRVFVIQM